MALLLCPVLADALQVRVKDVAAVADGGAHKLLGYGLVVGLQGTGDGKKALFTVQSLANMLEQFGLSIEPAQLDVDNVAAVMVTAELPSGATEGARLDVTVSSLGDASSLQGGTLLLTPLRGADGQVYAIAQGAVSVGGYQAGGRGASTSRNHTAVGRVPNGASMVLTPPISGRESLSFARQLSLQLHQPDFTTAGRLADSINAGLGRSCARAVNSAMVQITIPPDTPELTTLIRRIEALPVQPDMPARVVINERTGTVVIGSQVRILPVAIAHGALTVQVTRRYHVSQPPPLIYQDVGTTITPPPAATPADAADTADNAVEPATSPDSDLPSAIGEAPADAAAADTATAPSVEATDAAARDSAAPDTSHLHRQPPPFSHGGHTVVVPKDTVRVEEQQAQLLTVGGEATLSDLVEALNVLGVSPRDLIAIIQALKQAGALQAELIIQ